MDLFKSGKKDDPLREELSILSTSIETINQQLQNGGSGFDDRFRQLLSGIDHKLVQMYEQENKNAQNIVSYVHALISKEQQKTREHITEQVGLLNGAIQDRFDSVKRILDEQLQTQSLFAQHLHKVDSRLKEITESLASSQNSVHDGEQFARMDKTMRSVEARLSTLIELYRKELSIVRNHNDILKRHFDVSYDDEAFESLVPPKPSVSEK